MTAFRHPKPAAFPALDTPHWVVEASAGTGKTFTLEHLVVELVLGAGLPLEQVVVVTFTEAAALELRRRIRGKLQELRDLTEDRFQEGAAHWTIDDAARARLDAALQAFDRTVIATIHAFCQKVLQDAAFDAGRPFRQTRAAEEDLFADAFKDHLRTAFGGSPEDRAFLEEALAWAGSTDDLQARLLEAWKARATLVPAADQLDRARQAVAAFPLADLPAAEAGFQALCGKASHGALLDRLAELAESLTTLRGPHALEAWKRLRRLKVFDDPASSKWGEALWLTEPLEGPAQRVRASLADLRDALPSIPAVVVHRLLPPLQRAIEARKAAEGLFDFNDLIDQVADGVRNPALVARLRERYQAALIDEFQDTDARQWEIFRTVFHTPEHRLVLVGDPKQAIYDFRGGDLPTYLAATQSVLEAGGQRLPLRDNFRSSPALLDAVNRVLESEGGFFQPPNAYPVPVRAGLTGTRLTGPDGDLPPLRLLEVEATGGVGHLRSRIAAGLAATFRDLLAQGAVFHSGKEGEPPRPLHAGDFMVLTHTGSESKLVARALRDAGVPSTFFKADGLFQTREALELRDLLRGILHPEDPDARGRALLTRFFGFSLAEAEACLDLPAGHPVRARLERWQDLARQRRYARCFNALLEESGIVPRLLVTERGDRALTNLRHLLEHLLAEAVAAHLDPDDLLRRLGRWIEARDLPAAGADPDLQRAEGEVRAVRILTIHKAKGLEAPVVALFGGYSEGQGAKASLQRFHDAADTRCAFLGSRKEAPAELRSRMSQEAAREDERLLYVAMTRPQVQLVLPVFLPGARTRGKSSFNAEGHPEGRHGTLNRRLRELRDADPAAWKAWAAPLPESTAPPQPDTGAPALPARFAPLPLPPAPDFGDLARRGRPLQLHSFTSLARAFGDGTRVASREEEGRADEVEAPRGPRPADGLPGGTATGSALHALLERLPQGSTRSGSAEAWREAHRPLAEACLREQGLDPAWAGEALQLARLAMSTPVALPEGPEVRLDDLPRRLPEVGFQMPFPGHPDGLEGSLDLLFEAEGRLHVLDWKTNRLEGGDYGAAAVDRTVAAHYDLQVRIYTLAALAFAGIADEVAYEARWGGAVYVFLRGLPMGGVWTQRPAWAEVQGWRRDLAAMPLEALALERLARGMDG